MSEQRSVLVIDDNEVDRLRVRRALRDGYHVIEAACAGDGLDAAARDLPDCVVLDYQLPDTDDLDALVALRELDVAVVMLTGQEEDELVVRAMRNGARDFIRKDRLGGSALEHAVARALEDLDLKRTLRQRERDVERSRDLLGRTLEALPVAVHVVDERARSVYANSKWRKLERAAADSGSSERLTASVHGALRGEQPEQPEISLNVDGKQRHLWAHSELASLAGDEQIAVSAYQDVTRHRETENALRQAQKMEAVGQLAGGVAHDFNNLLTAILSFTVFARDSLPHGHVAIGDLDEVEKAAQRATTLTSQLLAFSRQNAVRPRRLALEDIVRDIQRMVGRLVGESINCELRSCDEVLPVVADASGLQQVVMNLAINARDAMGSGGTLTLETRRVRVHVPEPGAGGETISPGEYATLIVSDTGGGIPADVLSHIFEPFFTTKGPGKGTGLGLAMCFGLVQQAGGFIRVTSRVGHGTTFEVLLPLANDAHVDEQPCELAPKIVGGRERVLVVEDDEQVRRATVRTLHKLGYEVLEAVDAGTALTIARSAEPVDIILTDIVMPELSGRELVEAIREERPRMRVLFMSGYTDDEILRHGLSHGAVDILAKPFSLADLSEALRDVLARPPAALTMAPVPKPNTGATECKLPN